MKLRILFLILVLALTPIVNAELNELYIEKSFEANRKALVNDLNNRDQDIENRINAKYEQFEAQIKLNFSIYLFKFGLVLISSILIGGIGLYSLLRFFKVQERKIAQNKAEKVRVKFKELV